MSPRVAAPQGSSVLAPPSPRTPTRPSMKTSPRPAGRSPDSWALDQDIVPLGAGVWLSRSLRSGRRRGRRRRRRRRTSYALECSQPGPLRTVPPVTRGRLHQPTNHTIRSAKRARDCPPLIQQHDTVILPSGGAVQALSGRLDRYLLRAALASSALACLASSVRCAR